MSTEIAIANPDPEFIAWLGVDLATTATKIERGLAEQGTPIEVVIEAALIRLELTECPVVLRHTVKRERHPDFSFDHTVDLLRIAPPYVVERIYAIYHSLLNGLAGTEAMSDALANDNALQSDDLAF